ncbi:hypothetical protein [Spiroplasma monobiae]|uniref:Uncharacterized protein n=1 Tax=Spiroplasma monobiae MQ-1 TaxID=1336748 RepID=A0A2K9LUN3_SPISQ|nr:hypothetical protein [Spiroplasma monobiae]AUM62756.1 hypothetical protein SMONO_v1c05070 [Spiroplasma monobiae MQ-1]
MIKLLSLIGSLSLSATSLTPLALISNNQNLEESFDIGDFRPVTHSQNGLYIADASTYNILILRTYASALKFSGYENADYQFFNVDYIINDFTGELLTDADASGANGAKTTYSTVRISTNELGNANGFKGSANVTFILKHLDHDLKIDDNVKIYDRLNEATLDMKIAEFVFEKYISEAYNGALENPLSVFRFGAFEYTNYLISETGEKLYDEQLKEISLKPGESINLILRVRASEYGISKGIHGNIEVVLNFYNHLND